MRSARRPRPHRTWFQRGLLMFNVIVVVGALAGAAALAYVKTSVVGELPRVEVGPVLSEQTTSGEPENYLLVGIDNAAGLSPDDDLRKERSDDNALTDTMMILRVDPESERADLLSIPRDLWVPLADAGFSQKINAALGVGGPQTLIKTIGESLDIPVHHFVTIDFAGFQEVVEEIGGVPVYIAEPIRDDNTGIWIEETGCVTLDPEQALGYVRTRKPLTLDESGQWVQLGEHSDLDRIQRQQDFLIAAMRQGVNQGLRDPLALNRFLNAAQGSFTLDEVLSLRDILDLADRFRSFQPEELVRYELPVVGDFEGELSVLRLVEEDAQPILDVFRGVDPDSAAPETVRVQVQNGSGRSGEATATADALAGAGFRTVGVLGDAEQIRARTIVRAAPTHMADAALVARHLEAGAVLEEAPGLEGADVVVVTGSDYRGVRSDLGPEELAVAPTPVEQQADVAAAEDATANGDAAGPEQPADGAEGGGPAAEPTGGPDATVEAGPTAPAGAAGATAAPAPAEEETPVPTCT